MHQGPSAWGKRRAQLLRDSHETHLHRDLTTLRTGWFTGPSYPFMGLSDVINTGCRDQEFPSALLKMFGNVSAGRYLTLSALLPCSAAVVAAGSHCANSLRSLPL